MSTYSFILIYPGSKLTTSNVSLLPGYNYYSIFILQTIKIKGYLGCFRTQPRETQPKTVSTIFTTKVLIAEQQYKVMNAIFHHGSSIEEGHYTSMCREKRFWIKIDDA